MGQPTKWLPENVGSVLLLLGQASTKQFLKTICTADEVAHAFTGLALMTARFRRPFISLFHRLDQDHLETVVPQVGREVVVLWGKYEGKAGVLRCIDTASFSASIRLHSGEKVKLPYEQFSKAHDDDIVEVKVEPKKEIKKEYDLNVITIE